MAKTKRRGGSRKKSVKPMLFSSLNYKWLGVGCLLVIIGFTAMYLENEVYGFISLYVSPVVIMTGYMMVLLAILKKEPSESESQPAP